jgi:Fe-S-cluster containining protein
MQSYLREISDQVAKIHADIEVATNRFSEEAKLHCVSGCNQCCESPNVHVSVIDCLPLAFYLVETGQAEQVLKDADSKPFCPVLISNAPGKGRCGQHQHRPSLCRLFGFAAMKTKRAERDLVACPKIHAQIGDRKIPDAPFMEEFSRPLLALDPSSSSQLLPIRDAVIDAIAKVMLSTQFTP